MHAFVVRPGPFRRAGRRLQTRGHPDTGHRPRRRAHLRHGLRNQLQQRLGRPGGAPRRHRRAPEARRGGGLPRRRQRLRRHRLGRRRDRHQRQAGRRGGGPQRLVGARRPLGDVGARPHARRDRAHLGLPDQLRLLLPVRPRPGAPVPAQAGAPRLGRGGLLPAVRLDRLPHAHGLAAQPRRRGRRGPGLGRRRRPRQHGLADRGGGRRPARGRRLRRGQAHLLPRPRRRRCRQPPRVHPLGRHARHRQPRLRQLGQGGARFRQGDLGGRRRARQPAPRLRAPGRGHPADVPASSAPPAAWW